MKAEQAGFTDFFRSNGVNTRSSVARRLRLAARRPLSLRPSDEIAQSDDRDQIRRALAMLPVSQREAIVLVAWLGLTDEKAGRVLGVSAGAVRVQAWPDESGDPHP